MFIAALFTIAKTWEPPKYSMTEEWLKKMWYIYAKYSGIFSHKKEQINDIYSNMNATRDNQAK